MAITATNILATCINIICIPCSTLRFGDDLCSLSRCAWRQISKFNQSSFLQPTIDELHNFSMNQSVTCAVLIIIKSLALNMVGLLHFGERFSTWRKLGRRRELPNPVGDWRAAACCCCCCRCRLKPTEQLSLCVCVCCRCECVFLPTLTAVSERSKRRQQRNEEEIIPTIGTTHNKLSTHKAAHWSGRAAAAAGIRQTVKERLKYPSAQANFILYT